MIKRIASLVAVALIATAGTAAAQGITKAQLDSALAAAADTRKQTVAANMNLTPDQAKAFWPVYDAERAEIAKARATEVSELKQLINSSADSVTDKQIASLTKLWLATRVKEQVIRSNYLPKFQKVLPPKMVARYYQIEHRMDLIVALAVAQQIPLIN
jgi:Spy/CpxP family protein refolding chaperone